MGKGGARPVLAAVVTVGLLMSAGSLAVSGRASTSGSTATDVPAAALKKPRIRYVLAILDTPTSASVGAAVDTGGVSTTYYAEYGVTTGYGSRTQPVTLPPTPAPGGATPTTQEVRLSLPDLQPGTTYHVRVVAESAAGTVASEDKTLGSGGGPPSVSGVVVRAGGDPAVVMVGATIDTGGLDTRYRVAYGPGFGRSTSVVTLPALPSVGSWTPTRRAVRIAVSGLVPGKTYPFRLEVENERGKTSRSGRLVGGGAPPRVSDAAVVDAPAAGSLVVDAVVATGGLPTTYYAEYGHGLAFGARTRISRLRATPGEGWNATAKQVELTLTGLRPATAYNYRLVAVNAAGRAAVQHDVRTPASTSGRRKDRAPSVSSVVIRSAPSAAAVVVAATIDTGGLETHYRLLYGARQVSGILAATPSPRSWVPTRRSVRLRISSLTPGKAYSFRLVADNTRGRSAQSGRFRGGGDAPRISTAVAVDAPSATSAVIDAVVDTNGLATSYHLDYGSRPGETLHTPTVTLAGRSGTGWNPAAKEIEVTLTGLSPGSTYHYRLVAVNAAGTDAAENDVHAGGRTPSLTWIYATPGSKPGTISFGAVLDTGGVDTTYHVEFGTETGSTSRTDDVNVAGLPRPSSFRPTVVEVRVDNVPVASQTRYRYRIVAVNAAGTTESSERNVTLS